MKNLLPLVAALSLAAPMLAQHGRPAFRLDDANTAYTPDGYDLATRADGDLWVSMWTDERGLTTYDDDIYISVSTDGGKYWRREIRVTDLNSRGLDADDAWLAVTNGIIYISYTDDSVVGSNTAFVMSSNDLGQTWTSVSYTGDYDAPHVFAEGNNVLVMMLDGASSPNAMYADVSSTGVAGLAVNPLTQLSNAGGDADWDGYSAVIANGVAHVCWFDDSVVAFTDDLYYNSIDIAGAGSWGVAQLVNSTMDVDLRPQIAVGNNKVHFMYMADDVPGATNTYDDMVVYRNYDLLTSTFGVETVLSSLADDADYFNIGVNGDTVVMAWADDSTLDDQPRATFSTDGGTTLTTVLLPQNTVGQLDARWFGAGASGDYMFVGAADDSSTAGSFDELPTFWYSNDQGVNWYGPYLLGTDFQADEDMDIETNSWVIDNNGIGLAFQTDGGTAGPDAMMFSSISFPFAEMVAVPGSVTFNQVGNPVSTAGQYARWGVSTTVGSQVHPENPSLTVDLGPSAAYSITTTVPPVPVTTGTVAADGSASITIPTTLPPGTYYVQAWVNAGGLTLGGEPGDMIVVQI